MFGTNDPEQRALYTRVVCAGRLERYLDHAPTPATLDAHAKLMLSLKSVQQKFRLASEAHSTLGMDLDVMLEVIGRCNPRVDFAYRHIRFSVVYKRGHLVVCAPFQCVLGDYIVEVDPTLTYAEGVSLLPDISNVVHGAYAQLPRKVEQKPPYVLTKLPTPVQMEQLVTYIFCYK